MSDKPAEKCKAVFDQLFQSIAWLHLYWHLYRALYGTSPERFEVFNARTGFVFGVFERTLRNTILLEIAKLLGNHKSVGNEVVSIRRAVVDLPMPDNDLRKASFRERVEVLQDKHKAILDIRDRDIAHTDLAVALKREPLDGVSRAAIREAVEDCVKLTNEVRLAFDGSEYGFPDHRREEGEVQVLLKVLGLGNAEMDRLECPAPLDTKFVG